MSVTALVKTKVTAPAKTKVTTPVKTSAAALARSKREHKLVDPHAIEADVRDICTDMIARGLTATLTAVHVRMNYDERDSPTFEYENCMYNVPEHLIQYWLERWRLMPSSTWRVSASMRRAIRDVWDYSDLIGVGQTKSLNAAHAWFNRANTGLRGETIAPLSLEYITQAIMFQD